jgi:ABC-type uncharacterized transport system involved in gliding motility auxiliary subunit
MFKKFFSLFNKNKSSIKTDESSLSSITFKFDNDLNVTTHTRINSEIIMTLIDNDYLKSVDSEDKAVINLIFILMANEVTEQIIEKTNDTQM